MRVHFKDPHILTERSAHVAVQQVFCVFLFLVAASFFATLISQLNEIVAAQTTTTKELDDNLASYLTVRPRWEILLQPQNVMIMTLAVNMPVMSIE